MFESDTQRIEYEKETPMRRVYNQFVQNWQPLMRGHEAPDFSAMRKALEFDDTEFESDRFYAPYPEKAPTGGGLLRDDRETSHYVGRVLDSISPHLANVYRGGATNGHLVRHHVAQDKQYGRSV